MKPIEIKFPHMSAERPDYSEITQDARQSFMNDVSYVVGRFRDSRIFRINVDGEDMIVGFEVARIKRDPSVTAVLINPQRDRGLHSYTGLFLGRDNSTIDLVPIEGELNFFYSSIGWDRIQADTREPVGDFMTINSVVQQLKQEKAQRKEHSFLGKAKKQAGVVFDRARRKPHS